MSLVRLLTAGKSLIGIQDSKSRYRSVDPRAMPKFGSEKKAHLARESEVKPSVTKSNVESSKTDTSVGADNKVGMTAQADKNVGVSEKTPVATARKPRGSGWVSQWSSKLSSLVSQKPKSAKSAVPRFNGVPVQGELSLDNIKVVRNDLSDADLEVVTRKMAPAKKAESESQEWAPVKSMTPTFVSANSGELADRNVGATAQ
jgi:hypothetical protein